MRCPECRRPMYSDRSKNFVGGTLRLRYCKHCLVAIDTIEVPREMLPEPWRSHIRVVRQGNKQSGLAIFDATDLPGSRYEFIIKRVR